MGTENSHLRKYITTLGVSIVAASIALAGFFFRTQADLLVEASKVGGLTPTAQRTLARRQEYLDIATVAMPWVLLVTSLLGISLTAWGFIGWSRRQQVLDQKEDAERDRSQLELRKLSRDEEEEKRNAEAAEAVEEDPAADSLATKGRTVIFPPRPGGDAEEGPYSGERRDFQDWIRSTEDHFYKTLAEAFHDAEIQSNVRLTRGKRTRVIDALALPSNGKPGLVVEMKYSGDAALSHLVARVRDGIVHVTERITLVSDVESRYDGLLVLVRNDYQARHDEEIRQQIEALRDGLGYRLDVLVMDWNTATSLGPDELRSALEK